jgi:hypothetical protein
VYLALVVVEVQPCARAVVVELMMELMKRKEVERQSDSLQASCLRYLRLVF